MTQPPPTSFRSEPVLRIGSSFVEVQKQLLYLELRDQPGGLSTVEARIRTLTYDERDNPVRPLASDGDLDLGAQVFLGMANGTHQPDSMFQGRVTAIESVFGEGPESVIVYAEDALQHARMRRRTRTLDPLDLGQLIRDVCEGIELSAEDIDAQLAALDLDDLGVQVQLDESDLAFLRRILRERDLEAQAVQGVLQIRPIAELQRGTVELDVRANKLRCRILADLAHQVSQVTVSGFDPAQGSRISVTSGTEKLGPGRGRTGRQLLAQAFGEQGSDVRQRSEHLGHVPVRDQDEAQALADAMASQRARSFVTLDATAPGDPRIRVGSRVQLSGAGARFDNTYLVRQTCHRMDRDAGYETDFVAECAFMGDPR